MDCPLQRGVWGELTLPLALQYCHVQQIESGFQQTMSAVDSSGTGARGGGEEEA